MTKIEERKRLEQEMSMFISNGGVVTKHKLRGKKRFPKKLETETVEIDISHLPACLREKFFPDKV
jgi:hypothetical protein